MTATPAADVKKVGVGELRAYISDKAELVKGTLLGNRIVCPGRDSARALASYDLSADGFRGEVAMLLGGKNMTLTEHQVGRRLGECGAAAATAAP